MKKREAIQMHTAQRIKFLNGEIVKQTSEARYLGCMTQEGGYPEKEMNERMTDAYAHLEKKLDELRSSDQD